jgi:hypothetical protein
MKSVQQVQVGKAIDTLQTLFKDGFFVGLKASGWSE